MVVAASGGARMQEGMVTLVQMPRTAAAERAHGVAGEIARTFAAMAELPTASVAVCVGEGGSGGALERALPGDRAARLDRATERWLR